MAACVFVAAAKWRQTYIPTYTYAQRERPICTDVPASRPHIARRGTQTPHLTCTGTQRNKRTNPTAPKPQTYVVHTPTCTQQGNEPSCTSCGERDEAAACHIYGCAWRERRPMPRAHHPMLHPKAPGPAKRYQKEKSAATHFPCQLPKTARRRFMAPAARVVRRHAACRSPNSVATSTPATPAVAAPPMTTPPPHQNLKLLHLQYIPCMKTKAVPLSALQLPKAKNGCGCPACTCPYPVIVAAACTPVCSVRCDA